MAEWAAQAAQGTQGAVGVSVPLIALPVLPSIPQEKPQPCLLIGKKEYEKIKELARSPTEEERWDRLKTLKARQDAAFVGISLPAPHFPAPRWTSRGGGFTKEIPPLSLMFWGTGEAAGLRAPLTAGQHPRNCPQRSQPSKGTGCLPRGVARGAHGRARAPGAQRVPALCQDCGT